MGMRKLDIQESAININVVAEVAIQATNCSAKKGLITLSTKLDEHLPFLYGDEVQLEKMLVSLLSIAVNSTPPGGKVLLGANQSRMGDFIITVTNSDGGMDERELLQAKELAERHQGKFNIENSRGQGTTVTMRFPRKRVMAFDPEHGIDGLMSALLDK